MDPVQLNPSLSPREQIAALGSQLSPMELFWQTKQNLLEQEGYRLRPRLQAGWVPSWNLDKNLDPMDAEDFWILPARGFVVDATRVADGRLVYIKRVATESQELRIIRYFSQDHLRDVKRNHCVPLLDHFVDNVDSTLSYIVMPFLRWADDPPFDTVSDILEFTEQILEGLDFIHSHDVAHRDCAMNNLMMDATGMYPRGFHPVSLEKLPDSRTSARPTLRAGAVPPIKYYFIDFGISVQLPHNGMDRRVTGVDCLDKEVPELSLTRPYDPFKVDIFLIGNMLRRKIHDKFHRVDFLQPFFRELTQRDPSNRPDIAAARQHWRLITQRVSNFQRMRRPRSRNERWSETVYLDLISFLRITIMLARRLAGWSAAWLSVVFGF